MHKLAFIGTAALAMLLALAPTALGRGSKGGDGILERGTCTASSTWKLKAKLDDGRIETEFEVDQNRVGKRWQITLVRNGSTFFRGIRTTVAPSGSFTVRRLVGRCASHRRVREVVGKWRKLPDGRFPLIRRVIRCPQR